jgi:GNAT superfamily N-acetyltransferase
MFRPLGEEVLKSGERMTVGVVREGDREWLPRLVPFLEHKPPDYREHIRRALEGPLDRLRTRFYVGCLGDEIVSQGMVVGDRGAGILGHVYTRPEHRRKGAYARVMRHLMEDVRREGYRVLCLGTGYDTPPYWIYHSFGFRPIAPESGRMKWLADEEAEDELFGPGPAAVRDLCWDDWGYFDLLAFQPVQAEEELPRCPAMGLRGQGSLEGPFITFQLRRERELRIQAKVLETESGATVAWALLAPDPHWFRDAWLLDLHAHPRFADRLPELLAGLEWPDAPVAALATLPEGPRARALAAAGFYPTATLPAWLPHTEGRRDLGIWTRG